MASKVIELFIKKALFKKGGAMASNQSVKFSADALEKRLKALGIDPTTINTEAELNQILAYVKQAEDAAFNQMKVLSGKDAENALKKLMGQKTDADVFDLQGNKLNPNEPIMGGTQGIETLLKKGDITKGTVTKKSDKVKDREMFKAANERFKKTETEEEILERLNRENKEARKNLQIKLSKDKGYQKYKGKTEEELRAQFGLDDEPEKFYTGGIVDVEPTLSDIGHGSDALMARTRLLSPGAQGTTSTGLNYLLAEDNDNIRIPFKTGTDQSKRAFLKLLAALGGGIATLKSGLLSFTGKGATKKLLSPIQTDNVAGKPEWFDALVTRVIKEGDDVTKGYKTKERQIVHQKKLNEDETVTVTQDLDEGSITVDLDSPKNTFEDTVTLRYKKSQPDEGDPNPAAEFEVAESGPVGRRYGPDDYEIEVDEVGGTSIKDLSSDVSILKEYATNKKPTIKEIVQNMKRKDKAQRITNDPEAQSDEVIARQGEALDYDDYASGGRIGFSSGKLAITGSSRRFLEKVFGKEGFENITRTDPLMYKGMLEVVEMFRKRDKEGLKMYLQKYLPHMDDEMIEDFIVGSGGSEGIQGQLIRLGSGRDYAGKLDMMRRAQNMRKLDDLKVTEEMKRKPNASGGLAKLLGE